MFDKAKQMYQLQKQARELQKELQDTEIEAKGGQGLVTVVLNGELKIQSIDIDPSLLDPSKKRELEQALIDSVREGLAQAQQIHAEKSQAMMKQMGIDIPGL